MLSQSKSCQVGRKNRDRWNHIYRFSGADAHVGGSPSQQELLGSLAHGLGWPRQIWDGRQHLGKDLCGVGWPLAVSLSRWGENRAAPERDLA